MADAESAEEEALEAARRVYDRHVNLLENLDDAAMRTFRTDILVLGFVAAAVTAIGPDAANNLHWLPVAVGGLGVALVLVSGFVAVGAYNVSEYPSELRGMDLIASSKMTAEEWHDVSITLLQDVIPDVADEVQQNAEYVAISQGLLLIGTLSLAYATLLAVLNNSYALPMHLVVKMHGVGGLIGLGTGAVIMYKPLQRLS